MLLISLENADGLCRKLEHPCPKETPDIPRLGKDMWEISKESIKLESLSGSNHVTEVWKGKQISH